MKLFIVTTYPVDGRHSEFYFITDDFGGELPRLRRALLLHAVMRGEQLESATSPLAAGDPDYAGNLHLYCQFSNAETIPYDDVPWRLRKHEVVAELGPVKSWKVVTPRDEFMARLPAPKHQKLIARKKAPRKSGISPKTIIGALILLIIYVWYRRNS